MARSGLPTMVAAAILARGWCAVEELSEAKARARREAETLPYTPKKLPLSDADKAAIDKAEEKRYRRRQKRLKEMSVRSDERKDHG